MNRIDECIIKAAAVTKDRKVITKIKQAIVPEICGQSTFYAYLNNVRQPSLQTAFQILSVLQVYLPDLQLEDLVGEAETVKPKIKLS